MVTGAIAGALAVIAVDLIVRIAVRRRIPARVRLEAGRFRWPRAAINLTGFATLAFATITVWSTRDAGLTGDPLLQHVGAGFAFAVTAAVVSLCWAHRNRFAASDWRRFLTAGGWAAPARKFFFWATLVLAVPTLVSILAAMFPLFGAEGQRSLVRIHADCGPLLAAAGFLFWYFALVAWAEGRKD
jgi:hypothetical protein